MQIPSRSRTAIIAGQEIGVGVIGSTHTPLHAVTAEGREYMAKVVEGEHGCDTPLYTFEDARRGIAIPKGCLDLDLPPLAIEHPARMWNSLIHSLETHLQPIIKWTYERPVYEGGKLTRSQEHCVQSLLAGYIAHLTLALPPTHPSIVAHPLNMTVPTNSNSKEYIAVLEFLGGVKRYSGEARKLKVSFHASTIGTELMFRLRLKIVLWSNASPTMRSHGSILLSLLVISILVTGPRTLELRVSRARSGAIRSSSMKKSKMNRSRSAEVPFPPKSFKRLSSGWLKEVSYRPHCTGLADKGSGPESFPDIGPGRGTVRVPLGER